MDPTRPEAKEAWWPECTGARWTECRGAWRPRAEAAVQDHGRGKVGDRFHWHDEAAAGHGAGQDRVRLANKWLNEVYRSFQSPRWVSSEEAAEHGAGHDRVGEHCDEEGLSPGPADGLRRASKWLGEGYRSFQSPRWVSLGTFPQDGSHDFRKWETSQQWLIPWPEVPQSPSAGGDQDSVEELKEKIWTPTCSIEKLCDGRLPILAVQPVEEKTDGEKCDSGDKKEEHGQLFTIYFANYTTWGTKAEGIFFQDDHQGYDIHWGRTPSGGQQAESGQGQDPQGRMANLCMPSHTHRERWQLRGHLDINQERPRC